MLEERDLHALFCVVLINGTVWDLQQLRKEKHYEPVNFVMDWIVHAVSMLRLGFGCLGGGPDPSTVIFDAPQWHQQADRQS
jgi:hypothetical protein